MFQGEKKKERKKRHPCRRTFQERECATKVGRIRISRDFTVKSEEGGRDGGGSGSDSSNWILNPSIQARLRGFV